MTGKWNGSISMDFSKLPKDQQKNLPQIKQMLASMTVLLDLKKDGSFSASMAQGKETRTTTGKWFVKGAYLVTIDKMKDGKPVAAAKQKEDKIKILKFNGNTCTLEIPEAPPGTFMILKKK